MKKIMFCVLILAIAAIGNAQDTMVKTVAVKSFKAGGTPIAIPSPTKEMIEVGYDNREFMEVFVPSHNRLIAAFVLTNDLPRLKKGSDDIMSKYALVQVPRRAEYKDCGPSDFKNAVKGQFGELVNSSMKEVEEEFNRRMKSLDLDVAKMSMGKPVQLGCLFSKQDIYGFGMIMPLSMSGKDIKMVMGASLMRVKRRVIFVYLCAEYKNEDTVKWIRKTTEDWADVILKANK